MAQDKPRPWMIAAWPGMGNVAVIAAGYLVQELSMAEGESLPPGSHFDVADVTVTNGVVDAVSLPRGIFFRWKNPGPGRDLIVFISEAQPSHGTLAYAHELLDAAARMNVERIVTFASLASGLHPAEHPRVWGVATDERMVAELRSAEIEPIPDGQIGGLNGLVLGVARTRNMPGMCLLAEIPFFAMQIPNPKASRAALSVFSVLANVEISLESLSRQAAAMDRALLKAMEQMRESEEGEIELPPEPEAAAPSEAPRPGEGASEPTLDQASVERIEKLFQAASRDLDKAVALKAELDRLGVFARYEGRFLDLFRRAG